VHSHPLSASPISAPKALIPRGIVPVLPLGPQVPELPQSKGFQHIVLPLFPQHVSSAFCRLFRRPRRGKPLRPVRDPIRRQRHKRGIFRQHFRLHRPVHIRQRTDSHVFTHPRTHPKLRARPSCDSLQASIRICAHSYSLVSSPTYYFLSPKPKRLPQS